MGDTFYRLCSMGLAVGACGVVGIAPAISIKSTGLVLPSHEHEPRSAGLKPVTHQADPICYRSNRSVHPFEPLEPQSPRYVENLLPISRCLVD